jgi:hypothetical protein
MKCQLITTNLNEFYFENFNFFFSKQELLLVLITMHLTNVLGRLSNYINFHKIPGNVLNGFVFI